MCKKIIEIPARHYLAFHYFISDKDNNEFGHVMMILAGVVLLSRKKCKTDLSISPQTTNAFNSILIHPQPRTSFQFHPKIHHLLQDVALSSSVMYCILDEQMHLDQTQWRDNLKRGGIRHIVTEQTKFLFFSILLHTCNGHHYKCD